ANQRDFAQRFVYVVPFDEKLVAQIAYMAAPHDGRIAEPQHQVVGGDMFAVMVERTVRQPFVVDPSFHPMVGQLLALIAAKNQTRNQARRNAVRSEERQQQPTLAAGVAAAVLEAVLS